MTTVLRYPYEAITETTDYLQIAIKKLCERIKTKKE